MAPRPPRDLAGHFEMALPSFVQHLDVLAGCGLVTSAKQGRVRTYQRVPAGLAPAEHWLDAERRLGTARLDQLDAYLTNLEGEPDMTDTNAEPTTTPVPRPRPRPAARAGRARDARGGCWRPGPSPSASCSGSPPHPGRPPTPRVDLRPGGIFRTRSWSCP